MAFFGHHINKLDDKNRLILPPSIREKLSDVIYITKGFNGCLFILTAEEFKKMEEKIAAQPLSMVYELQRYYFGDTTEISPDKQGRILLSANQIKLADLKRDVVILGAGRRVELWDAERYAEWHDSNTDAMDTRILGMMQGVGL